MKAVRNFLLQCARVAALSALAASTVTVVLAWTGPSTAAPGNNVFAPINTGATAQTKSGSITAANFCLPSGICLSQSGYMFGGAYGWYPAGCYSNNPTTGSCSCPSPTVARLIIRADYASTFVGAYTYICM